MKLKVFAMMCVMVPSAMAMDDRPSDYFWKKGLFKLASECREIEQQVVQEENMPIKKRHCFVNAPLSEPIQEENYMKQEKIENAIINGNFNNVPVSLDQYKNNQNKRKRGIEVDTSPAVSPEISYPIVIDLTVGDDVRPKKNETRKMFSTSLAFNRVKMVFDWKTKGLTRKEAAELNNYKGSSFSYTMEKMKETGLLTENLLRRYEELDSNEENEFIQNILNDNCNFFEKEDIRSNNNIENNNIVRITHILQTQYVSRVTAQKNVLVYEFK